MDGSAPSSGNGGFGSRKPSNGIPSSGNGSADVGGERWRWLDWGKRVTCVGRDAQDAGRPRGVDAAEAVEVLDLIRGGAARHVLLVCKHEQRSPGDVAGAEDSVQGRLGLLEALGRRAVDEEDDGVRFLEVLVPD